MTNNIEKIIVGRKKIIVESNIPFGSLEIEFLNYLSKNLLKDKEAKK